MMMMIYTRKCFNFIQFFIFCLIIFFQLIALTFFISFFLYVYLVKRGNSQIFKSATVNNSIATELTFILRLALVYFSFCCVCCKLLAVKMWIIKKKLYCLPFFVLCWLCFGIRRCCSPLDTARNGSVKKTQQNNKGSKTTKTAIATKTNSNQNCMLSNAKQTQSKAALAIGKYISKISPEIPIVFVFFFIKSSANS